MIRAVVFDFDGLILDTETNEYHAYADTYRHHGAELPLEVWSRVIGTDMLSVFDPYVYLEERTGKPVDREKFQTMRRQLFTERMAQEQLRPGVVSVLEQAKELGLRIGLASSSSIDWITGYMDKFGIGGYFSIMRTRDNVAKVKPDPELYRQAVEHLGVQPHEALAFEDSPNGALAAFRAGLHCVIVPNAVTGTLAFGEHSKRIATMEGLDLERLLKELSPERPVSSL
ncbi:HAD family hydrolase [Paenibacillus ginsengarvi]|uniref:HAD family hydrolase n=1 Tax=Paenibacillus ginsengarvi TaxID=400777 RepID=A0A3B0CGH3_9BACL|nr:HAD family hydrolase [Paenibacillus ginsengarvi]RKN84111.1 HAD family hydrolase [Paenibacillus ginsengarvi]